MEQLAHRIDTIDLQSYNSGYERGYELGYEAAVEEMRERRAERKRRKEKEERARKAKAIYFLKQKALGFAMVAVGVATCFIDYDATAAVIFVPLGLWVMFTKEAVIYDNGSGSL